MMFHHELDVSINHTSNHNYIVGHALENKMHRTHVYDDYR